jgi:hypothetical protein
MLQSGFDLSVSVDVNRTCHVIKTRRKVQGQHQAQRSVGARNTTFLFKLVAILMTLPRLKQRIREFLHQQRSNKID